MEHQLARKAYYNGHQETCLLVSGHTKREHHPQCHYPVTKNGKLDCGRVRNAKARAAQQGKEHVIMKGGWKHYAKRCGVKSG